MPAAIPQNRALTPTSLETTRVEQAFMPAAKSSKSQGFSPCGTRVWLQPYRKMHSLACHPDRPRTSASEASGSGRTPKMPIARNAATRHFCDPSPFPPTNQIILSVQIAPHVLSNIRRWKRHSLYARAPLAQLKVARHAAKQVPGKGSSGKNLARDGCKTLRM
jgi:hypothetical protein